MNSQKRWRRELGLAVILSGGLVAARRTDLSISAKVNGSTLTVRTSARVSDAIDSITWCGKEFLNAFDHGRELQSASSFDGYEFEAAGAGARYPTACGSHQDAYKAENETVRSSDLLIKRVTIGCRASRNAICFDVTSLATAPRRRAPKESETGVLATWGRVRTARRQAPAPQSSSKPATNESSFWRDGSGSALRNL